MIAPLIDQVLKFAEQHGWTIKAKSFSWFFEHFIRQLVKIIQMRRLCNYERSPLEETQGALDLDLYRRICDSRDPTMHEKWHRELQKIANTENIHKREKVNHIEGFKTQIQWLGAAIWIGLPFLVRAKTEKSFSDNCYKLENQLQKLHNESFLNGNANRKHIFQDSLCQQDTSRGSINSLSTIQIQNNYRSS
ncbi:MAG: hypothetical protein EZS28_035419 [Streblomastix strix]|uniref:Uncharacterized protein n=1 Tax=Streblomastix strix TaxID=222440 RepID=A0A5J4UFN2_9EUKA|nr:MAG: hypothetical protein EZS28_035419 [Streblomastix strix]